MNIDWENFLQYAPAKSVPVVRMIQEEMTELQCNQGFVSSLEIAEELSLEGKWDEKVAKLVERWNEQLKNRTSPYQFEVKFDEQGTGMNWVTVKETEAPRKEAVA